MKDFIYRVVQILGHILSVLVALVSKVCEGTKKENSDEK